MTDSLWLVMLRSIARRRFQSLMFVLGVALGVAMIVAIDLANSSASRAFDLFREALAGKATHAIVGGSQGVPDSLYRAIRLELGLRESAPVVTNYAQAVELDNQPLRVFGIDPFAEAPFRSYLTLGAGANANVGDITAFLVQPNTALLSDILAQRYGLKQGSTFTLKYNGQLTPITIVGLLHGHDDTTNEALQSMVLVDISTAQEILKMSGRLTQIDLILPAGDAGQALQQKLEAMLPTSAVLQAASTRGDALAQMTSAFQLSLTALSLLALLVGIFLIYNTVMFSVVQRRPILGTLRALGVTRRQIFMMIIWEATLLGTLGAVIGLLAGVVMGRGAVLLVTRTINSLYFTVNVQSVPVSALSLTKGAVLGVVAAILAAIVPAYEATNAPPSGALRRSNIEDKIRRFMPWLAGTGFVLIAVAFALLNINNLLLSFVALFTIVNGFALLTPAITYGLMTLVRPTTGLFAGVLGLMAPRSIIRSLSRTSVAIAALMVAVSVIVGVNAMVGSFRLDVETWMNNLAQADIFLSPPTLGLNQQQIQLDPSLLTIVADTPGVGRVAWSRQITVLRPNDPLPVNLNVSNMDISEGKRQYVWANGTSAQVWQQLADGAVIVSETFARQRHIPIGADQTLTLLTDKGAHTFPIAAVMFDYSGDQGTVLLLDSAFDRYWAARHISTMAVFLAPQADSQQVQDALRKRLADKVELIVQSDRDLLNSVLVIFDQTFAITTALSLLASVVAFIGILSALMALQLERTREIGTMRANGLTRGQLFRLTLLETGLMGSVAALMAFPVGTVLAYVLVSVINVRSFGWTLTLHLQPEFYTQAILVALGAALLAGLYPAYHIGRLAPAQAVRAE